MSTGGTAKDEIGNLRVAGQITRFCRCSQPNNAISPIPLRFQSLLSRQHELRYVLTYMKVVNLLKLLTVAWFTSSCVAATTGAKPYAVSVERDVPPKLSYCELSFTFTNKGRYLDDLTIRYIAFDRQGNTLTESFVMFDTTGPNQKNIQKERIHADSLKSKIHPCSALARLVITTNGHLLEEREFTFITVDYPAMR